MENEFIKKEISKIVILYQNSKFLEAETLAKKLLEKKPNMSYLYNLLGLICAGQKKDDESINYYKKGISIQPNNETIYNNLATAYKAKKNFVMAEKYYKECIKLDSKNIEAHNNLGNLYKDLNKIDESIKFFKKSLTIKPNYYIAYYNLGVLYKSIGNLKDSKKCLKKAIDLNHKFYFAHRAFSQINKYKKKDNHINVMTKLYEDKNINNIGKIELAFALGKAFEDIKNFDLSFKYYKDGNDLKRNYIDFSIVKEKQEFNIIKKIFNKDFFNSYNDVGASSKTPIFILGMPRSGTTLVEQIVSSHPKVFAGDELNYLNDLIKKYFYSSGVIEFDKTTTYIKDSFEKIRNEYLNKIKLLSGNKYYVTDKMPINFKWIGIIKLIFPKSKIIHCTRNPKDTCFSIYKNLFTNKDLNYAYNINELINYYKLYNDIMIFWNKSLYNFIYENLINYSKKEIRKLIQYCDLNWNDKCLKFYNNKRLIRTASDTQVRNKIYKTSMNSWKKYNIHFEEEFKNFD